MFPKDHVPFGLCTKTTDRIKQKPQIEVDMYQHQGKRSICSSRCLSVTNLSLGVKENQNSDVFIVDWGVPIWKSSEKTWRWGVKIHHQQWESRTQPCHEIMIKRSCPAPTECVSLGSPRGKQCREELKHLLKQSEWERLLWGREKGAGRWCRTCAWAAEPGAALEAALCWGKSQREEPWDAGMAFGMIPPHPSPVCC